MEATARRSHAEHSLCPGLQALTKTEQWRYSATVVHASTVPQALQQAMSFQAPTTTISSLQQSPYITTTLMHPPCAVNATAGSTVLASAAYVPSDQVTALHLQAADVYACQTQSTDDLPDMDFDLATQLLSPVAPTPAPLAPSPRLGDSDDDEQQQDLQATPAAAAALAARTSAVAAQVPAQGGISGYAYCNGQYLEDEDEQMWPEDDPSYYLLRAATATSFNLAAACAGGTFRGVRLAASLEPTASLSDRSSADVAALRQQRRQTLTDGGNMSDVSVTGDDAADDSDPEVDASDDDEEEDYDDGDDYEEEEREATTPGRRAAAKRRGAAARQHAAAAEEPLQQQQTNDDDDEHGAGSESEDGVPRRKLTLTKSWLEQNGYFDMKAKEAARKLGIGITTLKRYCRDDLGIQRWPWRQRNAVHGIVRTCKPRARPRHGSRRSRA